MYFFIYNEVINSRQGEDFNNHGGLFIIYFVAFSTYSFKNGIFYIFSSFQQRIVIAGGFHCLFTSY